MGKLSFVTKPVESVTLLYHACHMFTAAGGHQICRDTPTGVCARIHTRVHDNRYSNNQAFCARQPMHTPAPGTSPKTHAPVDMPIDIPVGTEPQARTRKTRAALPCSHAVPGCVGSSEKKGGVQQARTDKKVSRTVWCCGGMSNGLGHTWACPCRKLFWAAQCESPPKNSRGLSKPVALRPEAATKKVHTSGKNAVIQPY